MAGLLSGEPLKVGEVTSLTKFHSKLFVYDKKTGELLSEHDLPANVTGAPMTYMDSGKQYIVFATGGAQSPAHLIAMAPP